MKYADRAEAGRALAKSLTYLHGTYPLVLGLPRGGVPVAYAVAEDIPGELDIILVRKLGVPWQPELAMGAITEGGVRVINDDVVRHSNISETAFALTQAHEQAELERRGRVLRGSRRRIPLADRVVVIVDDGMATGATALAACQLARKEGAHWIVMATPVSAPEAVHRVGAVADEVVCPYTPHDLGGVGGAYRDFHQLDDSEVTVLLAANPYTQTDERA